ncbi:hypothetical protein [Ensifer sp. ENS03]|uniref:hypothetical protein n=1 Tax=Ensifer sp. ENS03 TaxID=2769283 RepID=UPI0013AF32FE|nr:hypothetical protein [Ensifer sp. ENS03]MBD9560439.1 hypothetical protein [Ensifer sp. ENS03]
MFVLFRKDATEACRSSTRARIVEAPGLWTNEREVARLRQDLRKVAQRSVPGGELGYGIFSEREDALTRTIVTVVYRFPTVSRLPSTRCLSSRSLFPANRSKSSIWGS